MMYVKFLASEVAAGFFIINEYKIIFKLNKRRILINQFFLVN